MEKRKIIIGDYNTADDGWTLTAWKLDPAVQKTKFEQKPLGDGSWDLSTALTDGIPRYNDRELTVTVELSEGTRLEREEVIRRMVNLLDGQRWDIHLPDDEHHHVKGRVHVAREYNDPAHAAVTVTAVCEPWKYADAETVIAVTSAAVWTPVSLYNAGRKAVVPTITVPEGGSLTLQYGDSTQAFGPGVHKWPTLLLTPGAHFVKYTSSGTSTIAYREAVLE